MRAGNHKALLREEIIERVASIMNSDCQDNEGIIISMPVAQLTDGGRERIDSLNKALEQHNLPKIVIDGEKVSFPWFPYTENGDKVQEYANYTCELWKILR